MHNRRGKNNDKAKDFVGAIKKLLKYNRPFLGLIIIALILSALSSLLSIIGPDKLKEITNVISNGIMTNIDMNKINSIGLMLAILYGLSVIFNYLQGFIMTIVNNNFQRKIRNEIDIKINKLPLLYFDKTTVGDVLSRIINDVDTIGWTLNQSLSSIVSSLTLLFGSIFMMFYTNWILAITAILSTVFGFFFVAVILTRSQKYFNEVQNSLGDINGHIEEVFSSHNVIKAYNAEEETNKTFDEINERLFVNGRKSQFLSGLMHPLMGFVGNFGYVLVCVIGAILVMNKTIDFGVIVAFMLYIRLFTQPLMNIAQTLSSFQSAAAASERVFEFLEEEEMEDERDLKEYLTLQDAKGYLEFRGVQFGYNEDRVIIHNFNAKIKPHSKVAIVGPTGAGKTTIVNLLMKFYNINKGDILIDGHSIKNLTRENVHELFTMVLQDTWVFEGTIKENIRYNNFDITDSEIINACKQVGLHHFIKTLPKGYDTVLTDADILSSGEKQLLTIARAMISKTPYLILDEATSSVDTRTEALVQGAMDKLSEEKTSFIIAHRLSTIRNADMILVMNNGDIIEQGTHEELLEKNGFYAELYNSQFQDV